jgi:hypothetical protein
LQSIHDEYFAREDGKLKGAKRQKREWIGDTARLGSRAIAEIKRSDVTRLLDEVEDDTVQEQRGAFSPSCLRSSIGMRRTARSLMSRAGVDADIAARCRAQIGGVRAIMVATPFTKRKSRHSRCWREANPSLRKKSGNWQKQLANRLPTL